MIEIIKQPEKIHTLEGPVIFQFKGKENSATTVQLERNSNIINFYIEFDDEGIATVDITESLQSLLSEDMQTLSYNLWHNKRKRKRNQQSMGYEEDFEEPLMLGTFTLLSSDEQSIAPRTFVQKTSVGTQSSDEFIPIYTVDDLLNINSLPNPNNQPYVLMNDLDLGSSVINPIEGFNGKLYGQGFIVRNINSQLFSELTGEINDIIFDNISSSLVISGNYSDKGSFINCKFLIISFSHFSYPYLIGFCNLKYCYLICNDPTYWHVNPDGLLTHCSIENCRIENHFGASNSQGAILCPVTFSNIENSLFSTKSDTWGNNYYYLNFMNFNGGISPYGDIRLGKFLSEIEFFIDLKEIEMSTDRRIQLFLEFESHQKMHEYIDVRFDGYFDLIGEYDIFPFGNYGDNYEVIIPNEENYSNFYIKGNLQINKYNNEWNEITKIDTIRIKLVIDDNEYHSENYIFKQDPLISGIADGESRLNNCVLFDSKIPNSIFATRIYSSWHNFGSGTNYAEEISNYESWEANAHNYDGETISKQQAQSQEFYEGLGYDFDGSTQEDGQPVWAMGDDGYPTIVRPFQKFKIKKATCSIEYSDYVCQQNIELNEIKATNEAGGYQYFSCSAIGQNNKLYFGGINNNGIYYLDNDELIKQTNQITGFFYCARKGQDNKLYFGSSDNGIYCLDNDGIIKQTNITSNTFYNAELGHDNKLYFACYNTNGIYYLDNDGIIKYKSIADGFRSMQKGPNNRLYLGSKNYGGVYFLDDDGNIKQSNLQKGMVVWMNYTSNNVLYVQTLEAGKYYIYYLNDNNIFRQINKNFHSANCVAVGQDAKTYFAGDNGIYCLENNIFIKTNDSHSRIYCSGIGQDNRLYFAGDYGIYYLNDDAEFKILNLTNGKHVCTIKNPNNKLYFVGHKGVYYLNYQLPGYTGNSIATNVNYRKYEDGIETESISKSLLTDVTPEINRKDYVFLTDEEAKQRADELLQDMDICEDVTELNNLIEPNSTCSDTSCTIEWKDYVCQKTPRLDNHIGPISNTSQLFKHAINYNNSLYFYSNNNKGVWVLNDDDIIIQTNITSGYFEYAAIGQDNKLYFLGASNNGIWYLDDDRIIKQTNITTANFNCAAIGQNNKLYFGGLGVYYLDDDGLIKQTNVTTAAFKCAAIGQNNKLYWGTYNKGIWFLDNDGLIKQSNITNGHFNHIHIGQNNKIYFTGSSNNGIYYLDDDEIIKQTNITNGYFFSANLISENTLYFSGDNILYYLDDDNLIKKYANITEPDTFFCMVSGPDNVLYFGGYNKGIYYQDSDGVIKQTNITSGYFNGAILGPNNKLYFISHWKGIHYLDNQPSKITGKTIAKSLTYKKYSGGNLYQSVTKNLHTDVEPVISSEEYIFLTDEQVQERATELLNDIDICYDFTELNSVIEESDLCYEPVCKVEYSDYICQEEIVSNNDGIHQTNKTSGSFHYATRGQNNKLYFCGESGVWFLDKDGDIKQTNKTDSYFYFAIMGQDKKLYFGSEQGIWFLDNDDVIKQTLFTDNAIYCAALGENNKLYFGSYDDSGIYVLDNDRQIKQTNVTEGSFTCISRGNNGKLYFCSVDNGIWVLDDAGDIVQTNKTNGNFNYAVLYNGKLYFGGAFEDSLWYLNTDGEIKDTGLSGISSWSATVGQDGKLYFCTNGNGVICFDNKTLRQTNITDGIFAYASLGVDNKLYFCSSDSGIYFLDDDGDIKQTNKSDGAFNYLSIGQDDNTYLCSADNTGIWFFDREMIFSGNAAAKTITITKTISILREFVYDGVVYPILNEDDYKSMTENQIQQRKEALLASICMYDEFEELNEIIDRDSDECEKPLPPTSSSITIDGQVEEQLTFDGCEVQSQEITIEASGNWTVEGLPSWLILSQISGQAGTTVITIETKSKTNYRYSGALIFKLVDSEEQVTCNVIQNECLEEMELRLSFRLSEGITSADINISGYGSISITAPDHEIRIPVQELHQRFVVRCTSYATAESGLNSGGILKFSGVTGGIDISDECGTSSEIRVYAYGETYAHIVIYNSNYRCQ